MGYYTQFYGVLHFTKHLTLQQIFTLDGLLGEDRRNHPEWETPRTFYFIDLQITEGQDGLEWCGKKETYGMVDMLNTVIVEMRKHSPDFGLTGQFLAQGEEKDDRYLIEIGKDGFAVKRPLPIEGQRLTCPHCKKEFRI